MTTEYFWMTEFEFYVKFQKEYLQDSFNLVRLHMSFVLHSSNASLLYS